VNLFRESSSFFYSLVLKAKHDTFMPRHKFVSCILFHPSIILLLERQGAYSSIHYSTMSRRKRIEYSHKSGTGHHSNKRRTTTISVHPGRPSSEMNSLIETPLPLPIPPDTAAAMAIPDPDHQAHHNEYIYAMWCMNIAFKSNGYNIVSTSFSKTLSRTHSLSTNYVHTI
jgi:hypothetical protein